jgi:NAD(P)-dependent dehydrogenase (short-subunit alcohol dehydrogenase family)
METNVKGTMLCMRAISKVMSEQKPFFYEGRPGPRELGRESIVNVGSLSSRAPAAGMMAYTASKHSLLGMSRVASE